jgi:hypothetical protein
VSAFAAEPEAESAVCVCVDCCALPVCVVSVRSRLEMGALGVGTVEEMVSAPLDVVTTLEPALAAPY